MADVASLQIKVSASGVSQAAGELDRLKSSAGGAQTATAQFENSMGSMLKTMGLIAAATAGIYAIERAFKSGIGAVDQYTVSIIGIAAQLSNMAAPGQGSMESIFGRNLEYGKQMYEALNLEAAKHFASAGEMMTTYNRLVQSGYSVRLDEVAAVGTLTDKIKLATQGQNTEVQLNTEIMALMSGQAKANSLLAMELKSTLGPEWSKLVDKHKQAGDLLTWLVSLYPGLTAASKAVQDTMKSQLATTSSLLDLISIGGLGGAYQDIVELLKEANAYLRDHKEEIATGIFNAWASVKELLSGVLGFIQEIYRLVSVPVSWTINVIGAGAKLLSGTGTSLTTGESQSDFGFGALSTGVTDQTEAALELKLKQNAAADKAIALYKTQTLAAYYKDLGPTTSKAIASKAEKGGGAGGKSTDNGENRMATIVDTLRKSLAKLNEGVLSENEAALNKTLDDIAKVAKKGTDGALAVSLAKAEAVAKDQKVYQDFDLWYDKAMGDQYATVNDEEQKKLKSIQYTATMSYEQQMKAWEMQGQAQEVYANKRKVIELNLQTTMTTAEKDYLSAMASAEPYYLNQLGYQQQVLDKEKELALEAIKKQKLEGDITASMAEQLTSYANLSAAAKQYTQDKSAWESKGIMGGLKIAEINQANVNAKWLATQTSTYLAALPQQLGTEIATWMVSTAQGKKTDFEALGWSMAQSFTAKVYEGFLNDIMPLVNSMAQKLLAAINGKDFSIPGFKASATPATDEDTYTSMIPDISEYHYGGIVRAHSGLAVDEIPAILQTGERVLSREQNKAYENGSGNTNVTIVNKGKTPVNKASVEKKGGGSSRELIITLDDVVSSLIEGGGKTAQAMDKRYNTNPAITVRG